MTKPRRRFHRLLSFVAALSVIVACEELPPQTSTPSIEGVAPSKIASEAPRPGQATPPQPKTPTTPKITKAPISLADLVEEVRPSVVNIYTTDYGVSARGQQRYNPLGDDKNPGLPDDRFFGSLGTGFMISNDGYILTNYHVVEGASLIKVRFYDGKELEARPIGNDPKTDIALIKVEGENFHKLALGDSDAIRVGDGVLAIGNPLGLSNTVTSGILSARGRKDVPLGGEISYMDFLQTDASINPGNSGGPLIALSGEVIGINTAISREGQGIGFAIPINMAKDILEQLQSTGHVVRSWIGAFVDTIPKKMALKYNIEKGKGTLIDRVVIGGPAHTAGLKNDDIVLIFDGKEINQAHELRWLVSTIGVGTTIELEILRNGKPMKISLTTAEQPR